MSNAQIFLGIGLIIAMAVGAQTAARALRIPAIIILLPLGFLAGAWIPAVDPTHLFGPAFQPMISLAVAVVLFDAGLELNLRGLTGGSGRIVQLLIVVGVPLTWLIATLMTFALFTMSTRAAVMTGVILVVSGPTVVGPLLAFVRPTSRLRTILVWESSLIDPVGGVLGAIVYTWLISGYRPGDFLESMLIGLVGAAVGTGLLTALLRNVTFSEALGTQAAFGVVVAIAAVCDAVREDTGLIAAVGMGLALAHSRRLDIPRRRPFFETIVQLIIGVLFVSISATVTPASVRQVILPTLGLVLVLILVGRPLIAAIATARTNLSGGERGFIGWMAPRGIVAAATASTFGVGMTSRGIAGAGQILPITFLVIVLTVVVYGLTAVPVARRLGVAQPASTRPLLVGGSPWVVDLACVMVERGIRPLLWAGSPAERNRITTAGLDLAPGRLLADATYQRAELEGITSVLLLTAEDDFNALAADALEGDLDDGVYRIGAPEQATGVVAPFSRGEVLFSAELTGAEIIRRHRGGARFVTGTRAAVDHGQGDLLFVIRPDGHVDPVTNSGVPDPHDGDYLILLEPGGPPPGEPILLEPASDE